MGGPFRAVFGSGLPASGNSPTPLDAKSQQAIVTKPSKIRKVVEVELREGIRVRRRALDVRGRQG